MFNLNFMKSGEWITGEEKKMVKGQIDIPEFSYGELDDLQVFDTPLSNYRLGYDVIMMENKMVLI